MFSQKWHLAWSQVSSLHPLPGVKTGFPCPSCGLASRRLLGTGSRYGASRWAASSSPQRVHKPVARDYGPNPCPVETADLPEGSCQGDKVQYHTPFSQSLVPEPGFPDPQAAVTRTRKAGKEGNCQDMGRKGEQRHREGHARV